MSEALINLIDAIRKDYSPGHLANLTAFYRAYCGFVDLSANPLEFKEHWGLCSNLKVFCDAMMLTREHYNELALLQADLFEAEGLHPDFPFYSEPAWRGSEQYHDEKDKRTNPLRVAWCRRWAEQL